MPFASPGHRAVIRTRPGLFVIVALLALVRAAFLSGAVHEVVADGHGCRPGVLTVSSVQCPGQCATWLDEREDTRRPDGGTHRSDVCAPCTRISHGSPLATGPHPGRATGVCALRAANTPAGASVRAPAFPSSLSVVLRC